MDEGVYPSYWTETQLAKFLQVSPRTLQAWRYRGGDTPPFVKVGRAVRYEPAAVKAWARERERRSTSDPGPEAVGEGAAPPRRSGRQVEASPKDHDPSCDGPRRTTTDSDAVR